MIPECLPRNITKKDMRENTPFCILLNKNYIVIFNNCIYHTLCVVLIKYLILDIMKNTLIQLILHSFMKMLLKPYLQPLLPKSNSTTSSPNQLVL